MFSMKMKNNSDLYLAQICTSIVQEKTDNNDDNTNNDDNDNNYY